MGLASGPDSFSDDSILRPYDLRSLFQAALQQRNRFGTQNSSVSSIPASRKGLFASFNPFKGHLQNQAVTHKNYPILKVWIFRI
jgi:hypothetical protein